MKTAFITGHRCIIRAKSTSGINQLTDLAIQRGFNCFLSGMAVGTDLLAAQIWAKRQLTWKAILPFPDQSNLWTHKQRIKYRQLLAKATEVKVLYPEYSNGVFQARDQYLVNNSSLGLAVWDGRKNGGTYLTITMARKAKLPVIIFNPKTLEISHEEPLKQLSLFED
ncbi:MULTISPECIES: SLOG family protein [Planktothrix]|jgi:uncharacterized phage-like protein YoqJ|uniref:Uncharacterized protein n=2 Tax=Planktothrix TaxID=54304 RepID=A0A6J7ZEK2_PLARU|nr:MULTISPECIES: SLOG family protein [Planktothrix]CAD5983956.1 hypothetical protein NO108_04908 [Planktothrix rubescens]MCB8766485.1 DUF1273 domain-containing protein [Planktothrix agardhii 1809]MCB8784638.1 DUF1273 domain-containing protein [Planktothrix agardhii 1808]MCF3568975.1 DUF1273 domain-containing protein [Planktothrix agardhii 1807]MCF3592344.1 DUF1273 domain-containing protein [Planktothrix agardhii 1029]